MKKMALLAALALIGGCTDPLDNYQVYIADGFSPIQEKQIRYAMERWETAEAPLGLKISVSNGTSSDPKGCYTIYPKTTSEIIVLSGEANAAGRTEWGNSYHDDGEMYLPSDLGDDNGQFLQIVAHETGHLLGGAHLGAGSLMFWGMGAQAHAITCADQAQYANQRNRIAFCEGEFPLDIEASIR